MSTNQPLRHGTTNPMKENSATSKAGGICDLGAISPANSKRKRKKRSSSVKYRPDDNRSLVGDSTATERTIPESRENTSKPHVGVRSYPYSTDYNDHFETPLRAYLDILPLMQFIINNEKMDVNSKIGRSSGSEETIVYDPYFCTGRAGKLLKQSFGDIEATDLQTEVRVQHEKRDFYQDIRQNRVPPHDILVTNPPYSDNHKERCLDFAVKQLKSHGRPFFLLMPNYVANKEYFRNVVLKEGVQMLFIAPVPSQPYEYDHPEGTGHGTPPFQSMWFCGLSCRQSEGNCDERMADFEYQFKKFHSSDHCVSGCIPRLAKSLNELIHIGCVPGEKRKNPRQRKKMRQQAIQKASIQK